MNPLEGITVVSLEQAVAAPFASRQLADLGARVIKIERPGSGDFARGYDRTVLGQSSHFVWLNRSKESLTLDMKHPQAAEVMARLLARADVFIQNLAPGAAERLGLGAAALRARHPRLVVCGISGYGTSGPYAQKKAYDLLVQCESGVVSVTGTEDTPSKAGISIADIAAGMYAYSGILTALFQRERTGEGAVLDVSMFESLGEWMGYPAYYAAYGGAPPPRTGAEHATIFPYGAFPAGDGKPVFFGIQNEREWERFCREVIERPDLVDDPRCRGNAARQAHRAELRAEVEGALSRFDAGEVVRRLDAADIANARLNSMQEFWDHPQLAARGRWRDVDSPAGRLRALLPPANLEGCEARMDPIPAVGEHTRPILAELGFAGDMVAQLAAAGAI
jgi:crotonobetainyl-CoA:carnitine CoA-transferase CaiB-like acyl-CoA transferase